MPMALSMAPLYSLGQDDENEVQHDIFGHVTPLVQLTVYLDTDRFVNGTTALLRSRQ